jgi:4-carboxymuconolactone decarboxylase
LPLDHGLGKRMRPALTKDPLFRKGLKIRKAVVGGDYVERRLATAGEHDWMFEEAATKFAWGSVWSRPGLSRKMRSLINISALTAMNLRHELKLHIRAGLRNGLTRKEIAETLLHCAVYCGFPKSLDAFRLAKEVFEEVDAESRRGKKRR